MFISYDGACKGNGTPECISVGACILDSLADYYRTETVNSTNQRGELNGVIEALKFASLADEPVYIVTDSEFIFNSITKEWCLSWPKKDWISSSGGPIKNQDQWKVVVDILDSMDLDDLTMIYVKGHVLPFTKLAANKILDEGGIAALHRAVEDKFDLYDSVEKSHQLLLKHHATTTRINGYELDWSLFKKCVCYNMVTDLLASIALDNVVASSK